MKIRLAAQISEISSESCMKSSVVNWGLNVGGYYKFKTLREIFQFYSNCRLRIRLTVSQSVFQKYFSHFNFIGNKSVV